MSNVPRRCAGGVPLHGPSLCRASHPGHLLTVADMIDKATEEYLRKNFAESFRLVSQAHDVDSDRNNVNFLLGELFHKGLGVMQDLGRASEHYEAAHAKGHLDATNKV